MKEILHLHKSKWFIGLGITIGFFLSYLFQSFFLQNETEWEALSIPQQEEIKVHEEAPFENIEKEKQAKAVIVDVKGEVKIPGVYQLFDGDRVIDAIFKAGGFTNEANSSSVNLAALIKDEMVIYVPKEGEELTNNISTIPNYANQVDEEDGEQKININTATEEQLITLSGIGPSKAKAIIKYREENGLFQSVDDLLKVSGIGKKSLDNIRDEIMVGN